MDFDASVRPFRERLSEGVGNFALLPEKIFEGNGALGGTDRGEHGRENLFAVFQDRDLVAFDQGRPQKMSHGADKGVVARAVIRMDAMAQFFFVREKIARDEEGGETTERGGAEELCPLRIAGWKRVLHWPVSHVARAQAPYPLPK